MDFKGTHRGAVALALQYIKDELEVPDEVISPMSLERRAEVIYLMAMVCKRAEVPEIDFDTTVEIMQEMGMDKDMKDDDPRMEEFKKVQDLANRFIKDFTDHADVLLAEARKTSLYTPDVNPN